MADFIIEDDVLKKYTGSDEVVVIPEGVTSIGDHAFDRNKHIKSISIPDGVINIGNFAFYDCKSLTHITIPESVASIERCAFGGYSHDTDVHITSLAAWCNINFHSSDSNPLTRDTVYANKLYLNGELVTDLVIPEGVTNIGDYAFDSYKHIKSITIPDSVISIGKYAFSDCSSIESITIPASVERIESGSFHGCKALNAVHITDLSAWCNINFHSNDSNPLSHANKLYLNGNLVTDLVIPDGFTSIKDYVFYGCNSITSITIPDSVTNISDYAFCYCRRLTNITFPNSVTSIGIAAFRDCWSLTSITIPESVTSIGKEAFYADSLQSFNSILYFEDDSVEDRYKLKEVHLTSIAAWCGIKFHSSDSNPLSRANKLYLNGELVTDLVIPEGVTNIGDYAFNGCKHITSITIPSTLRSINDCAFWNCNNIKQINIPDIESFMNIDMNDPTSNPICPGASLYINGKPVTSIVIPEETTVIKKYIFSNLTTVNSVVFNSKIRCIETKAFSGCTSLEQVVLPTSIERIEAYAFKNCSSMKSFIVPKQISSIFFDKTVLEGCSKLKISPLNKKNVNQLLLTICTESDAEVKDDDRKIPVYLRFKLYKKSDVDRICTEASHWKIRSYHSEGSDYGYDSRSSDNSETYFDIPLNKIVVEDGHFAGIAECNDCSAFMKEMSRNTSVVVALTKQWEGSPIQCGCYGKSFSSDDHESWDITTHYLCKKD